MPVVTVRLTSSGKVVLDKEETVVQRNSIPQHEIVWVRAQRGKKFTFAFLGFITPGAPIVPTSVNDDFILAVDTIPPDSGAKCYHYVIIVHDKDGKPRSSIVDPAYTTPNCDTRPTKQDEGGRGVIRNQD